MLPIGVPSAIEGQCAQGGQTIAGLDTPLHPAAFLAAGHEQIVGLLSMSATDVTLVQAALAVVGNPSPMGLEISTETVQGLDIERPLPAAFPQTQGTLHLPVPERA